jgi:hypothetical protein
MQPAFLEWLEREAPRHDSEDRIDPRQLLAWSRTLRVLEATPERRTPIAVELSGTHGRAKRYSVIPVKSESRIRWLDASGYRLAISSIPANFQSDDSQSHDYDLVIRNGEANVVRTF